MWTIYSTKSVYRFISLWSNATDWLYLNRFLHAFPSMELWNYKYSCVLWKYAVPKGGGGGGSKGIFYFLEGGGLGFKTYFRYVLPCRFKKRCVNINNKMCWRFTELWRFDRGIEVVNYPLPYIKLGFQVFV